MQEHPDRDAGERDGRAEAPFALVLVPTRELADYVHAHRATVFVLPPVLLEAMPKDVVAAAVTEAIRLGAIGFDAVKHLILCRVERRPPRLDLSIYPYLPRATVETTSAKAYMRLLSSDAGEAA